MKKLTKLSLHNLSQAEMAKREQNMLKGGYEIDTVCVTSCACKYAGEPDGPNDSYHGGSSKNDSSSANSAIDKDRPF